MIKCEKVSILRVTEDKYGRTVGDLVLMEKTFNNY